MTDRRRMRDVDHRHPISQRTAGDLFRRGPIVVTDGGRRRDAGDEAEEDEDEPREDTMRDVSHTPPYGDGANEVHRRGRDEDE